MRIGEVAQRAGVSVRSLRYYEQQELVRSERGHGGQRRYTEDVVDRVRLIQQLFAAGLPSRVVRDVLPCVDSGTAEPGLLERLEHERERIDERITGLQAARGRLDEVIANTRNPPPECDHTWTAARG